MTWLYFSVACWLVIGLLSGYLGWSDGGWRGVVWLGLCAASVLAGYGGGALARVLWAAWKSFTGAA